MSLTKDELLEYARAHVEIGDAPDVLRNDCALLEFLMDNCTLTLPPENRFFGMVDCGDAKNFVTWKRAESFRHELGEAGLWPGERALAHTGIYDFGHTAPVWEDVITLGVAGLRRRIAEYAEKCGEDPKKVRFYGEMLRAFDAALRFMHRAAEQAAAQGREEMAQSLRNLTERAPKTLYEAMQTVLVYYVLQHRIDCNYVRTLGRLDKLFYPYYIKEEPAAARAMVMDFVHEIDRLRAPSNIPFALGGTDAAGKSLVNELTYLILDTYKTAGTTNTKLHLLCPDDVPDDLLASALEGVRRGNNSIVFMGNSRVIESLESMGREHADAANFHVVGCYECGAEQEVTCSCNARVSLPKALEYTLFGGLDPVTGEQVGLPNSGEFASFDALFSEYLRQQAHLCRGAMQATDLFEAHYAECHCSPFLTATYRHAVECGGDVYCDGAAKYCSSSLNGLGLATAVDSLVAIRKLVYEDHTLTLSELREILRCNWEGEEALRLRVKNRFPKYGQGNAAVDAIAQAVVDALADEVRGKPNVKGGDWRLGLFSIDWRWDFGKKTAASADGRLCGEPLSQNTGASFGADKEGATAHLISAARIDTAKTPNGAIVDIDLHASAVKGENGLNGMVAALKTYFDLGGFAVHYNVLDTETLKAAKADPVAYPNLQVRLCGWNVLFSALSEREKDEFIARSIR